MEELLYSALDIAIIVSNMNLGVRQESRVLDYIWDGEQKFLPEVYQKSQRKFLLDVSYWMNYFYDKPIIDREVVFITKELEGKEHFLNSDDYVSDFRNLDLFFKSIRIEILYGSEKGYVRLKLRTLLKRYGYRRRSKLLLEHVARCMEFYHLEAKLKGGVPCRMEKISMDDMITFRVR